MGNAFGAPMAHVMTEVATNASQRIGWFQKDFGNLNSKNVKVYCMFPILILAPMHLSKKKFQFLYYFFNHFYKSHLLDVINPLYNNDSNHDNNNHNDDNTHNDDNNNNNK